MVWKVIWVGVIWLFGVTLAQRDYVIRTLEDKGGGPKLQGPLTVNLNGTEYRVDVDVCEGGVVLKARTPVLALCGVGVFGLKRKACASEVEEYAGVADEYTCTSFPGGVQAIVLVGGGDGSTEGTPTEVSTTAGSTEGSTLGTESHLVETTSDLAFEHNNLIEKRGVKLIDLETTSGPEDSTTEGVEKRAAPTIATANAKPSEKTSTTGKPTEAATENPTAKPEATTGKTTKKTTTKGATASPEEDAGEEDTVPLEDEKQGNDTLGGKSDDGMVRPYDVKPNFPVETPAEDEDGSGEDTVPIKAVENSVVDSVLDGRSGAFREVEGGAVDFEGGDSQGVEFSSEVDERGGDWERGGGGLPEEGTLEYDVLTGGIDNWVKLPEPSPLFDAHLTLLRKQIDFEIEKWGVHTDEVSSGGQSVPHESVVGIKDLPVNASWVRILAEIATTASMLVPPELFRDSFSVPGGGGTKGLKGDGWEVTPPLSNFFSDVFFVFSYFARSFEGVRLAGDVLKDVWKGFGECRGKADAFRGGVVLGGKGDGCVKGVEVKGVKIVEKIWDEMVVNYTERERVVNFSRGEGWAEGLEGRIDPGKWVFAEVMWWAVQVTYVFCFEAFSGVNPNSFMLAFDAVLRVFGSDVVEGAWGGGGGDLGVIEMLLPYVNRGVDGDEFRGLLGELDKIFMGVVSGGVVGGFSRGRRRGGRERNSWDRRRKRDVGDVSEGVDGVTEGESIAVGGEKAPGVLSQTGWFNWGTTEREAVTTEEGSTLGTVAVEESSPTEAITSTTAETTSVAVEGVLRQFEIWDGLAYCVVRQGGGGIRPSAEELRSVGVCD